MQPYSRLVMSAYLAAFALQAHLTGAESPLDVTNVEKVRMVFHSHDYDERQEKQRQYLIRMGEKAFPAYEAILSDPKSPHYEVCGVLVLLRDVKADRRCFLKHAISRLTDAQDGVRLCAVTLLEYIGTTVEASPVVALLSDEDTSIVYAAARTLAAIGGSNEVVAMDIWLRGARYRYDADIRKHVQKCRDELRSG